MRIGSGPAVLPPPASGGPFGTTVGDFVAVGVGVVVGDVVVGGVVVGITVGVVSVGMVGGAIVGLLVVVPPPPPPGSDVRFRQ
jgi:hypothetical protein